MRLAVRVLWVWAIVATPALARAQFFPAAPAAPAAPAEKPVRFGGRVGLSLATLHGHVDPTFGDKIDASGVEKRMGISVSVLADFHVASHFAIEAALGYGQKGFSGKDPGGGATGGTIALDYVQVPVLAVGLLPVGRIVRLRAFGGPSLGYLLSATAKQGGDGQDSQRQISTHLSGVDLGGQDIEAEIETFDLGVVVGAGVDVELPVGLALFDVRYELGLRSIDAVDAGDAKNRMLTFNAGFAI